jgi:hypothetical protein
MVVMLWIVVFVVKGTFRAIPTVESYGAGDFCSRQNPYSGYAVFNVHLTSIDYPQIEGKFTATTGGLTNLFYCCKD